MGWRRILHQNWSLNLAPKFINFHCTTGTGCKTVYHIFTTYVKIVHKGGKGDFGMCEYILERLLLLLKNDILETMSQTSVWTNIGHCLAYLSIKEQLTQKLLKTDPQPKSGHSDFLKSYTPAAAAPKPLPNLHVPSKLFLVFLLGTETAAGSRGVL